MNEKLEREPVLTEAEQKAKERLQHATEDFTKAIGRQLEKQGGVNIAQMYLLIQMLGAQIEVVLKILCDEHADFRERFWTELSEMFDKMSAAALKQLIVVAQPNLKQ